MTEDVDDGRPRGVLSNADREYLREPGDYSRQASHAREEAIRERMANTILDYPLLANVLGDDRLLDVVHEIGGQNGAQKGLAGSLKAQIRFVYYIACVANMGGEQLIKDAIDEAKESRVDVLKRRLENDPTSLTLGELSDLYKAGEMPESDYENRFRDTIRTPDPGTTSLEVLAEALGGDVEFPDGDTTDE